MTAKRIFTSYELGIKDALEKVAMGGFGEMLSSLGGALKNPMRAKVDAASKASSSGNLGKDVNTLIRGKNTASKVPSSTTSSVGG